MPKPRAIILILLCICGMSALAQGAEADSFIIEAEDNSLEFDINTGMLLWQGTVDCGGGGGPGSTRFYPLDGW